MILRYVLFDLFSVQGFLMTSYCDVSLCFCYPLQDAGDDEEDDSERESERERIRENISQKLKKDKMDEKKTNPETVKKTSRRYAI